ncbi:Cilia- and flagella-associated protein 221 [Kappamyces sp. JEL0829]|nr:Cilia- and flagella-associated protein 221 [Kappamyces sp. JEL0829]
MFSIEPSTIEFPFHAINGENQPGANVVFTRSVKLRNTGSEKCRFSVHVLQEQEFQITQHKAGAVFPGKFETVSVQFIPMLWKVSKGVFYVRTSQSDEMVPVTITAYPFVAVKIPKSIDFGKAVLYQPKQKTITITNDIPVDFDFAVSLHRELPPNYFSITPMSGTLHGLETLRLSIYFMPLTLCQAQLEFSFRTSQEKFEPLRCLVFGSGEIDVPKSLVEKTVLEPIPDRASGRSTVQKREPNVTFSVDETDKPEPKALDLFTAQLEENIQLSRKSEVCRFVSVGKELVQEQEEWTASRPSSARKSLVMDSSEFRIEVPSSIPPPVVLLPMKDRSGNRLLQLFLKNVHKLIVRIRASRRIKQLKKHLAGTPLPPFPVRDDTVLLEKIKALRTEPNPSGKVQRAPPKPFGKAIPAEIAVPPLPDLLKPAPTPLRYPTYAERKGYRPLSPPEPTLAFEIKMPQLVFEQIEMRTGNEAAALQKSGTEPAIPEIHVNTFPRVNLHNAIPGVNALYCPSSHINDESSPQFVFHSVKEHGISGYARLSALELELDSSTREMAACFSELHRSCFANQ